MTIQSCTSPHPLRFHRSLSYTAGDDHTSPTVTTEVFLVGHTSAYTVGNDHAFPLCYNRFFWFFIPLTAEG